MASADVQQPAEAAPAVPDYLASPNAVFADEGVKWRYGRAPDYSKTRKVWEEGEQNGRALAAAISYPGSPGLRRMADTWSAV